MSRSKGGSSDECEGEVEVDEAEGEVEDEVEDEWMKRERASSSASLV